MDVTRVSRSAILQERARPIRRRRQSSWHSCSEAVLEGFLEDHGHELPHTAVRYSIEHMNPEKKHYFMGLRERRTSSVD